MDPDKPIGAAATRSPSAGKDNPLAPDFLVLNTARPQPFVNTSVHFLNGFDYLYDADGGWSLPLDGRADPISRSEAQPSRRSRQQSIANREMRVANRANRKTGTLFAIRLPSAIRFTTPPARS